jgi:hypothetical protein
MLDAKRSLYAPRAVVPSSFAVAGDFSAGKNTWNSARESPGKLVSHLMFSTLTPRNFNSTPAGSESPKKSSRLKVEVEGHVACCLATRRSSRVKASHLRYGAHTSVRTDKRCLVGMTASAAARNFQPAVAQSHRLSRTKQHQRLVRPFNRHSRTQKPWNATRGEIPLMQPSAGCCIIN